MNKKILIGLMSVALLSSVVIASENNNGNKYGDTEFSQKYAQSTYGKFLNSDKQGFKGRPPRPDMQNGGNEQGFKGRPPRPDMQNGGNGQGFKGRPPRPDMQNGGNGQGFKGRPPRPDMQNGGKDQGFQKKHQKMNGNKHQYGHKKKTEGNEES